jgi:hypothetical protein
MSTIFALRRCQCLSAVACVRSMSAAAVSLPVSTAASRYAKPRPSSRSPPPSVSSTFTVEEDASALPARFVCESESGRDRHLWGA